MFNLKSIHTKSILRRKEQSVINRAELIPRGRSNPIEVAIVAFKMNVASEDFSSKVNVASELNIPEIKVTPEIDVTSKITCETDVPEKNFIDDASKVDAISEIHIMSNTNIASNNIDRAPIDKSFAIDAPPRRLRRKLPVDQRECHPVVILNPTVSKQKFETDDIDTENVVDESRKGDVLTSDGNFFKNIQHEENSKESCSLTNERSNIQQTAAIEELFAKTISETKEARSSTVENEKSKLERASAMIGAWKTRMAEASVERRSGIKKKKAKLRNTKRKMERKMESIEKILEDHVERIWEENVEKHSWLQPIDTWIGDHCKPSSSCTVTYCQRDVNQDVVPEPAYNFTPTMTAEEPKIESEPMENQRAAMIDEPKIEIKVVKHLQRLRNHRAGSPKSNQFESANLAEQLKKQEIVPSHETGEENPNVLIDPGILKVKEVKRHDLLDKLKDNVKEKMEDIHRVVK